MTGNPLWKTTRLSLLYCAIALIGFIILGWVALNIPENMLLRQSEKKESPLKQWMLPSSDIPSDMILISRQTNSNKDIAKQYSDQDEMLKRLSSFGREDGYSQDYASKDRCRVTGPRSIHIALVLHKDGNGVQQYLQWIVNTKLEAEKLQQIDIGDGGFVTYIRQEGFCFEKYSERVVDVSFRRNKVMGTVSVSGSAQKNQDQELSVLAERLAKNLDSQIQFNQK